MAKSTIGFSVYLNGKLINEVKFDRPIINVGKLSTSTLRLDDINVSRKHAVIEQREDGKWRVTDLGSTNGTVLRGERVVQAEIKDGDRLVLGTTTLVVHIDEAAATRAAPVVATSGVAGDRPAAEAGEATAVAAEASGPSGPAGPSGSSGPVKPDEIRGLGEESFYKKRTAAAEGSDWALDVALLWGETVLSSKTFRKSQDVVLADNESADFAIPREILGSDSFRLARATDGGFELDLSNPNITGDVLIGDKVQSVQELAAEKKTLSVKGALRARLKVGEFTILVAHQPLMEGALMRKEVEKEPLLFIAISAVVQVAFLIIAQTAPDDLLMATRDPRAQRQKVLQALKITPEQIEEEKKKEEEKKIELRKDKQHTDDELKVDKQEVTPVLDVAPQPKVNPLVDKMQRKPKEDLTKLTPEQRQQRAKELAQQTAMEQAFKQNNPLFDKLTTSPDLDSKPSPFKALGMNDPNGGQDFAENGNVNPFSGFDATGNGFLPSDGGLPPGSPDGPVITDGLNKDPNSRDLGPVSFNDKPPEPRLVEAPPRISGELDEKTVQQYIRRYLSGIKWCYQDRLQSNRKLGGKVTLAFTILPNGSTHDARAANSSLGDEALEGCIATKMARWRFPQPKDGGVVEVAYPLILKTQ